jgi:tmRNA-binding protein
MKDGFVLQGGQLKLVRNGNLYIQDSPVTLKNGTIIMTDGLIKLTNGSTPLLRENDFIDLDGNIRPLKNLTIYY